jgi:C-terminal domain 7 of the ABC-three component (ABC-3C) systems
VDTKALGRRLAVQSRFTATFRGSQLSARSHGAAPSALGYAYQSEAALVELVRRAKTEPATKLTIERYDDVAFEQEGRPRDLLQSKHHIAGVGDLTDRSRDLWRTLRAWIDALLSGDAMLPGTTFSLLTTSTAPDGSAASLLRTEGRDAATALATLELVAAAGGQVANASAYQAFLALREAERRDLVGAIVVLDRAPSLGDVTQALIDELGWSLRPRNREQMAARLLEWWDRRVITHLLGGQAPIEAEEVFFELDALRDEFSARDLPVDITREQADQRELGEDERIFVQQLQLLAMSNRPLELAIRDYKRAFMQRARWTEDTLVSSRELRRYEERLLDEWEHVSTAAWEAIGDDPDERQRVGREVYDAIQGLDLWIRPSCQERFVSRGSYHMLANELKVGWHPDFLSRLRYLLETAT